MTALRWADGVGLKDEGLRFLRFKPQRSKEVQLAHSQALIPAWLAGLTLHQSPCKVESSWERRRKVTRKYRWGAAAWTEPGRSRVSSLINILTHFYSRYLCGLNKAMLHGDLSQVHREATIQRHIRYHMKPFRCSFLPKLLPLLGHIWLFMRVDTAGNSLLLFVIHWVKSHG